jgi:glycosyltransferase involved in cell wall biosynthesis
MPEPNPLFSIITVCLNCAAILEKTILSVISQDYKNYEFIIIDGGSIDGSIDIIKKYKPKIDTLISEKDNGIYDAMNKGILLSKGQYLFFLNAGDLIYSKDTLKDISLYLADKKNTGIINGRVEYFDEDLGIKRIYGSKLNTKQFWMGMPICHQAFFFNKKIFSLIGLYDLRYRISSDYDLLYRFLLNKDKLNLEVLFINQIVSKYLMGGVSLKDNLFALKEVELINRKYIDFNFKKRVYYKYLKFVFTFKNFLRNKFPGFFYLLSRVRYKMVS